MFSKAYGTVKIAHGILKAVKILGFCFFVADFWAVWEEVQIVNDVPWVVNLDPLQFLNAFFFIPILTGDILNLSQIT